MSRCGNNSPTLYAWRPLRHSLAHVIKVSYAYRIQEEDITPLFQNVVMGLLPINGKVTIFLRCKSIGCAK